MVSVLKRFTRVTTAATLIALFALPAPLMSQDHVVAPSDLQKEMVAATQNRQRNAETLTNFLTTPAAEKALKTAHLDATRVKSAVATLSDKEMADLAARANKAQTDFAAGRISDRDLLLILVGIAALILIIVAVR